MERNKETLFIYFIKNFIRRTKGGGQCGEETEGCCKQEQAGKKKIVKDWVSVGLRETVRVLVPPNGHHDAYKQKLCRKSVLCKVITQQTKKELKILQTGEFQP